MKSYDVCAVILCAGTGSRTKLAYNKILHYIGNKTVLETALDKFDESRADKIVLVINPADEAAINEIISNRDKITVIYGGATRTQSVRAGLKAAEGCKVVAIADCARPFVSPDLINRTIESTKKYGSGIAAVKAVDTIKISHDGKVIAESLNRNELYAMQTPQTFDYNLIADAYEKIAGDYTDDAEVYSLAGHSPVIVEGEYENKKITTAADLFTGAPERTKIGAGFDVHELKKNRPLILGGVNIPHSKGLYGHSDADVLTHAIMDALLSAAQLPDIGVLFPDTDKKTEGISSLKLLDEVCRKLNESGYTIGNVSAVIMAQKPKLAEFIPQMISTLSARMNIKAEQINISATTTEHLGIIGEEKGMAASAACLLYYR